MLPFVCFYAQVIKKRRKDRITSVTRDDLADGGASIFVRTVSEIKRIGGSTTIELLIPDFNGDEDIIKSIASGKPEIIGHNLETVRRLYALRPEADYQRSLEVLRYVRTDLWDNPRRDTEGPFRLTEAGIRVGYAWFGQSMGWAAYMLDDLIEQMGWWK